MCCFVWCTATVSDVTPFQSSEVHSRAVVSEGLTQLLNVLTQPEWCRSCSPPYKANAGPPVEYRDSLWWFNGGPMILDDSCKWILVAHAMDCTVVCSHSGFLLYCFPIWGLLIHRDCSACCYLGTGSCACFPVVHVMNLALLMPFSPHEQYWSWIYISFRLELIPHRGGASHSTSFDQQYAVWYWSTCNVKMA